MKNTDREKLYNGILGLAVGDALGVPAEFMPRSELKRKPITDMIGGGAWNQPAGTWSDDTAMTLATVDALNKSNWKDGKLLYDLIMTNFILWYTNSTFAANGHRFDIGNTCRDAIEHYSKYNRVENCGRGEGKCGNGALMRILPTAFLSDNAVLRISRLTHNNFECDNSSLIYVHMIRKLCRLSKDKAFEYVQDYFKNLKNTDAFSRILSKEFSKLDENQIKSSGYVIDTLEAAVWCFLTTDNYRDCVLKAVNLGEDTDTVAAVAGGLAGLYYGINEDNGIPQEWINKLRDIETLKNICLY